jgi:hypothetical protein
VSFSGRWQIFGEPPRITVLFQTMHDIIGNAVAFFFRQLLAIMASSESVKRFPAMNSGTPRAKTARLQKMARNCFI